MKRVVIIKKVLFYAILAFWCIFIVSCIIVGKESSIVLSIYAIFLQFEIKNAFKPIKNSWLITPKRWFYPNHLKYYRILMIIFLLLSLRLRFYHSLYSNASIPRPRKIGVALYAKYENPLALQGGNFFGNLRLHWRFGSFSITRPNYTLALTRKFSPRAASFRAGTCISHSK